MVVHNSMRPHMVFGNTNFWLAEFKRALGCYHVARNIPWLDLMMKIAVDFEEGIMGMIQAELCAIQWLISNRKEDHTTND